MVAGNDAGDARADLAHDARALMAQHAREDALAVEPVERIGVGVADARRHDLDQHLARLRAFEVEFDDFERLLRFERDGGAGLHGGSPSRWSQSAQTPRQCKMLLILPAAKPWGGGSAKR